MTEITNLPLKDARPDNQAHLLIWDAPTKQELWHLAYFNNAEQVNYRENLVQRLTPGDKFLNLHHAIDEELGAIRSICKASPRPVVLLEGLDTLITYLRVKAGGQVTLFWRNLEETRKLESLLWILLPQPLTPHQWPENRILRVSSST
jgi:hypothetical protein